PNVVGQDSDAANNALGLAGFKTSTKTQSSDTVPAGKVVSTSPPGGSKATKGSVVTMVVSSGPSPTTTEASTSTTPGSTATVPNVINLTESGANTALANKGFLGSCSATGSPGNGRVITQNPSSGTQAQTGSTVSYEIAATTC
ncbi:MAG TPA: PASTA domain-containing protein, partial [Acidimicrobiales bacterium]|nr:PASTA domain-containing protein [Acidimicrobiales bacterium]